MVLNPTDSQNPINPMNNGPAAGYPMPNYPSYNMVGGIWRPPQSWLDIPVMPPLDPRAIVITANLQATLGNFIRSTTFLQASWGANPFVFTGNNNQVVSLDTTDAATSVDATQWTFAHQMVNASATIPSALSKVIFLRAGEIWDNQIEINLGVSNYTNVQLSFRDNLATSGTFLNGSAGSVPVILFPGTKTGILILHLTIRRPGKYSMVLVANNAGTYSAFEMEWIVLP